MRGRGFLIAAAAAFVLVAAMGAVHAGATRSEAIRKLGEYQRFFTDFQQAPDYAVPGDLLAQCHGIIIMRQYKAGFVFGVKGGDGVALLHDPVNRTWSAPAFLASGEGSFGFQIGGQAIDAIILIMNQNGIDMLFRTRFKIGVDASAAAGPVGRDAAAKVAPGTALLAYSRAKGLYAGVSFEGGALVNNDAMNQALYGRAVGIRDILVNSAVAAPPESEPFINTLNSYAAAGR